jgi:phosphatidylinositol-3-phosphatase
MHGFVVTRDRRRIPRPTAVALVLALTIGAGLAMLPRQGASASPPTTRAHRGDLVVSVGGVARIVERAATGPSSPSSSTANGSGQSSTPATPATPSAATRTDRADTRTAPPSFDRVVLVVFENKEFEQVIGNPDAPTFNSLARRYALLTNYTAVTHPSLPNYLALVSGSTHGITSNCTSCQVNAPNLADTLERAGKSWKTYAEGLPRAGFTGAYAGRYAKKHNPLVYFANVVSRPDRLRRIVPLSTFRRDLKAGRLPDLALVVPDLCHDMHDCSVATGDAWLGAFLRPFLRNPALRHGVVFVLFDEGTSSKGGGGRIPALVLGPLVRHASRNSTRLDHYGLLRTIENAWALPLLGDSRGATPITRIWR